MIAITSIRKNSRHGTYFDNNNNNNNNNDNNNINKMNNNNMNNSFNNFNNFATSNNRNVVIFAEMFILA